MTTVSTNTSAAGHLGRDILGFFSKIGHGLVAIGENNPRLKRLEYLSSLTDEALAEKGLKREDIVRHVFGNKIYL